MRRVELPRLGTFEVWREEARALAARDVPAERVTWAMAGEAASLFDEVSEPLADGPLREVTVPKDFPPLALTPHQTTTPPLPAHKILSGLICG